MQTTWALATVSLAAAVDLALVDRHGLVAVSPATGRWLRNSTRRLLDYLGDENRPVDRVAPREVAAWVQFESGRGISAVSVNSNLRGVKTLYSRLQKNGVVGFNPASPVPFLPEPPPRPKAVSEGHYIAMRTAAHNGRDRALVDMLWASGCRLGGLLSMSLKGLEVWCTESGEWRAAVLVTEKFAKSRYVYARGTQADSLRAWLAERPAVDHDALFLAIGDRAHGRPLTSIAVQHVLRRLRLDAGIPAGAPTNAHAFRHAYAIRMLDAGHDLAAVSAWLGHSDPAFTARTYVTRREDELRRKWFGD